MFIKRTLAIVALYALGLSSALAGTPEECPTIEYLSGFAAGSKSKLYVSESEDTVVLYQVDKFAAYFIRDPETGAYCFSHISKGPSV